MKQDLNQDVMKHCVLSPFESIKEEFQLSPSDMDVLLTLVIYADLAPSHSPERVIPHRFSRHVWMEMTGTDHRHDPVAELVVEEVALTPTVALDVGVWLKVLQAAA